MVSDLSIIALRIMTSVIDNYICRISLLWNDWDMMQHYIAFIKGVNKTL